MNGRTLVLITTALLVLAAAAPGAFPQDQPKDGAEEVYFRAYYLEKALRDFEAAHEAYDEAVRLASFSGARDLHIRAVLGRGRCLVALGRMDEAKGAYQWVFDRDPENEEARAFLDERRAPPSKNERLLSQRIDGLVESLGSAEREQAQKDLLLVGNRAVPKLSDALRSHRVGVAEGAAKALARIETEESFAALARGFSDQGVVFPKVLVESLGDIQNAGRGGFGVFLAAMESSGSAARARAIELLGPKLKGTWFRDEIAPQALARVLDLGLTDPAPEPKVAVLQLFQRHPTAFNSGGHDPLGDEAWIHLISSEDAGVSWNAMSALSTVKREAPWSPELCRAIIDTLSEIVAGRRDVASYRLSYFVAFNRPEKRAFSTEDLIGLFAAAAESEALDEKARQHIFGNVFSFLEAPRKKNMAALSELARLGWSRIHAPEGRKFWLERFGTAVPKDVLLEAAGDDSSEIRGIAYESIYRNYRAYETEEIVAALTRLEEDLLGTDHETRKHLLSLLYYAPVPPAAEHLRKLRARDIAADLRITTLSALAKALETGALPDIRADLAGDYWEVPRSLLVKLLGSEAVPELIELAKRLKDGAKPVLSSNGYLAVPPEVAAAYVARLPEELRNGKLVEKTAPALSPEARADLVIHALKSGTGDLIRGGATAAASHHVAEAWPYLIPLLDHTDQKVREQAKTALTSIRTYRELKASFAQYGPGGASEVLEDAMRLTKSEDPVKRRGGALALGALGNAAGIPVLLGLLDDPEPEVRDAALSALEKLGGNGAASEEK